MSLLKFQRVGENSELLNKHASSLCDGDCLYNTYNSNSESIHAEERALKKAYNRYINKNMSPHRIRSKFRKHTLTVVRLNNDKTSSQLFKNSMPCVKCVELMRQYCVKEGELFNRYW